MSKEKEELSGQLTPAEIVAYLDQFIIGQKDAKKAVAIALRNRSRRLALGEDPLREEIHPKNIIMMGPTGVGKTEIARRLARLVNAPFVKVEATKYTEVGYVGRDVESMIRDLVMTSIKIVRNEHEERVKEQAEKKVEEKLLDLLYSPGEKDTSDEEIRELFRRKLQAGEMEDREVEIPAPTREPVMQVMAAPGMEEFEQQMQSILGDMLPKKRENKRLPVSMARKILLEKEIEDLVDSEKIRMEAVERAEQQGIIFIDEIDKIASRSSRGSGEVSREGVQRDILPLVEGSTVNTRLGQVKTDHVLFIAAGAFHVASVQDLIPELQGRFPIRVELNSLGKEDFITILTSTRNALTVQYQALLSTEGVVLEYSNDGIDTIAEIAEKMNDQNENIGARRLHTIMEKLLEDISFEPEKFRTDTVKVDRAFVQNKLASIVENRDLSRYIL